MRKKIIVYSLISILAAGYLGACGSTEQLSQDSSVSEVTSTESTVQDSSVEEDISDTKEDDVSSETAEQESKSDKVASSDEMTTIEEVVEEGMVPIYTESLKDGTYDVTVSSSSSMFKIDSCELTVDDGQMTARLKMGGTGYLYLYPGTGADAVEADENTYIPHEEDEEGVHYFTFPVEALDDGIACAAYSKKKEKWYDRTILFRADSLPTDAYVDGFFTTWDSLGKEDGTYSAEVSLAGGSGKAGVESPANLYAENGICTARIVWSSSNYDYMIVNGEKYLPVNSDGNSTFEIPVTVFDTNMPIIADTTAMSEPHEISYTLRVDSASLKKIEE